MKTRITKLFFVCLLTIWGCGQHSHDHSEHDHMISDSTESTGNKALYDEVNKVHNEVMAKMDSLYKLKMQLKDKLPTLAEEGKIKVEATILKLDSASEGMMDFMHAFKPLPDSVDEEKAREYLETEMEKVNKVKADILEALEEAKKEI